MDIDDGDRFRFAGHLHIGNHDALVGQAIEPGAGEIRKGQASDAQDGIIGQDDEAAVGLLPQRLAAIPAGLSKKRLIRSAWRNRRTHLPIRPECHVPIAGRARKLGRLRRERFL